MCVVNKSGAMEHKDGFSQNSRLCDGFDQQDLVLQVDMQDRHAALKLEHAELQLSVFGHFKLTPETIWEPPEPGLPDFGKFSFHGGVSQKLEGYACNPLLSGIILRLVQDNFEKLP